MIDFVGGFVVAGGLKDGFLESDYGSKQPDVPASNRSISHDLVSE